MEKLTSMNHIQTTVYELVRTKYAHPNYGISSNPAQIIDYVCKFYDVTQRQVESKSRKRKYVAARQMICYILSMETRLSLVEIGRLLGGRDHTTIIHSREVISGQLFSRHPNEIKDDYNKIMYTQN